MLLKITGENTKSHHTILAGDIGATKTNLAVYGWSGTTLNSNKKGSCKTGSYDGIQSMINHFF